MTALRERIRWLTDPGTTLGQRTANAGAWAFALRMVVRMLTIVQTVVLARLVAPTDFGLMGIAMLVIGFATNFTQTGFSAALVQRKGELEREYLDTAWTVEVVRGLAIGTLVVLGAPLVGSFFGSPEAVGLTRLLGAGLAIAGFLNIGVVTFDKELEFQRRFVFRSVPPAAELLASVILAFALRNAWALAFGWVAGRLAMVIASFVASGYRPRLRWDVSRARELFDFGIWLLGSQILLYFMLNLDDIVVGRILTATALGLYQMAFTMSQVMTTEITGVVNQVAFPAYSKVQGDIPRLRKAYLASLQFVAFLTIPMTAGLWFVGEDAVRVVLGEKWLPIVPAFYVLLIWGLIRSLLATTGPLFRGIGKPRVQTKIQLIQLVLLAAAIVPFTNEWGIVGAAWATVVAAVAPDAWALVLAGRETDSRTSELLRPIAFPAVQSLFMLGFLVALERAGMPDGWLLLLWAPLIGTAVYFGMTWMSRRWLGYAPDGLLQIRPPS